MIYEKLTGLSSFCKVKSSCFSLFQAKHSSIFLMWSLVANVPSGGELLSLAFMIRSWCMGTNQPPHLWGIKLAEFGWGILAID